MKKYIPVVWPDVQYLMECDGFYDHSYPILDDKGIDDFGSSAYMVEETWLNVVSKYIDYT